MTNIELTMSEKQAIMLEILKDIDKFCRANHIRYSISSGTMLGAVRHGGFIPWDDDADIMMVRKDFDRFVATYKSDKYHLLFNTRKKDEYLVYGFAKVIDPNTYVVDKSSRSKYGVFVDIFPLDHVPADQEECDKHIRYARHLHNRLHHRQKKDIVSFLKAYFHSEDWWWNKLNSVIYNKKYSDSPNLACFVDSGRGLRGLTVDMFDSLVDIKFEDHKFLALSNYHEYLVSIFGEDYMVPKKWAHNLTIYWK